ncbi:MAG: AraC family transcriptional regulator [Butyrivibrio sp.]|nr:AraC family transcriptional regulator [Butyrivibrio sp.]
MQKKTRDWTHELVELLNSPVKAKQNGVISFPIGKNDSILHVCKLWEGVFVWANDIYESCLSNNANFEHDEGRVYINICLDGRCEVNMPTGEYIYMSPGILCVAGSFTGNGEEWEHNYPTNLYKGIEISIDLKQLRLSEGIELSSYGITSDWLKKYIKRDSSDFGMQLAGAKLLKIAENLYKDLLDNDKTLFDYRYQVLSMLYEIKNEEAIRPHSIMLVSKGQRRIANEVAKELTADLTKHITIEQLSQKYNISQSSLKKYFEMVYGKTISFYQKEKRMEKAGKLIIEKKKSIGEIASECGYENQSKFSSAFKAYTGSTPIEYRRLNV